MWSPALSVAVWRGERWGAFGTVGGLVPLGFDTVLAVPAGCRPGTRAVLLEWCTLLGTGPTDTLHAALWEGQAPDDRPSGVRPSLPEYPGPLPSFEDARPGLAPFLDDGVDDGRWAPWSDRPLLDLPHRSCHLWSGPVSDLPSSAGWDRPGLMVMPGDRRWFLHQEVDGAVVVVGLAGPDPALLAVEPWCARAVPRSAPLSAVLPD